MGDQSSWETEDFSGTIIYSFLGMFVCFVFRVAFWFFSFFFLLRTHTQVLCLFASGHYYLFGATLPPLGNYEELRNGALVVVDRYEINRKGKGAAGESAGFKRVFLNG